MTQTASPSCHFCPASPVGYCCWPVERFVEAELWEIREGDKVRRWKDDDPAATSFATVREVAQMPGGVAHMTIRIVHKNGTAREKRIEANDFSRIRVLRPSLCGLPACEAHAVDRGDLVLYCQDHWTAWQGADLPLRVKTVPDVGAIQGG